MSKLPAEIKLSEHAKQRLEERKEEGTYYNTNNLMKSSRKWYGKDDLIPQSNLYLHSMYICRKAKNKFRYMTDGEVEILYDKNTGVAITVLEVKEKFLPITQYIKPSVLAQIEKKKNSASISGMDDSLNYHLVYRDNRARPVSISELLGIDQSNDFKEQVLIRTV